MSDFLNIAQVSKSYGPIAVLHDVDFAIAERESVAIIGPNGAGKTTLFRVLTGESAITSGKVQFQGEDITRLSASARVGLGFSRTFQVSRVFSESTVEDNIVATIESRWRLEGRRPGQGFGWRPRPQILSEAMARLADIGLADSRLVPARELSHGDRKRLELAMALALEPTVLMLDEPTAGMSPAERTRTIALIDRLRRELKLTILLTEHEMDVVYGLADRIIVMNHGRLIAEGTAEEVRANPMVQEVYLGKEVTHA